MKKSEALYAWPVEKIRHLVDSVDAENFADSLREPEQNEFVRLTEEMRAYCSDMERHKESSSIFGKWQELRQCIDALARKFSNFSENTVSKLRLSLLFAESFSRIQLGVGESLKDASGVDADNEIDAELFDLVDLVNPLPLSWFCKENSRSIEDSMAVVSCNDLVAVKESLDAAVISPYLLLHYIAALHRAEIIPSGQAIFVKRSVPPFEPSMIDAFAQLVVLASGKHVHAVERHKNPPSILNLDAIRLGEAYQQWSDVLNVLSEYNSRDEVLLKFLTIYHVVENFMYRLPIVELESQMQGCMFSIRDFRRLYKSVEIKEIDALTNLFKHALSIEVSPGKTFTTHFINRLSGLGQLANVADIDRAFDALSLNFNFKAFCNAQRFHGNFSKLVYVIRNSIVHNKETEFHLTYAALKANNGICRLIVEFIFPSLEEVCFELISKRNNLLWYSHKEIMLYK